MNVTLDSAAAEYLEAVREALADQPADEVAEIIDDLAGHLDQVTAELGDSPSRLDLEQRLGTAQQYAEELRTAAGLTHPAAAARPAGRGLGLLRFVATWLVRIGGLLAIVGGFIMLADGGPDEAGFAYLAGVVVCAAAILPWLVVRRSAGHVEALRELPDAQRLQRGVAALRERPAGSETMDFIGSLRSAWWLLRAWLAMQAITWMVGSETVFPIKLDPAFVTLLVLMTIGSVWLGRRAEQGSLPRRLRWSTGLANATLAVTAPAIILLVSAESLGVDHRVEYVPVQDETPRYEGFFHEDGTEIINLYVYGPDGELIEGVQIYDQDGRPVENVAPWKHHECLEEGGWFPGGPQGNVYPKPGVYYNTQPPRCAEPGEAAPFGSSLPGIAAEPGVAEAEVDSGSDIDATEKPAPAETPPPGGRSSQPDTEVDPTVEPG